MSHSSLVFSRILSFLVVFGSTILVPLIQCSPEERRLLKNLLQDYEIYERPVKNPKDPLTVRFGFTLMQILDLDFETNKLTTNAWLSLEWNDYNLKWNPEDYGNISSIRLPIKEIWSPDVYAYNNMDPFYGPTIPTNAVIRSDGNITYIPPFVLITSCITDPTNPEQKCDIKFGSWTYDGGELDLQLADEGGDVSSFTPSRDWGLIGVPAKRNAIFYACCPDPYIDVTYTIHAIRARDLGKLTPSDAAPEHARPTETNEI